MDSLTRVLAATWMVEGKAPTAPGELSSIELLLLASQAVLPDSKEEHNPPE